MQTCSREKCFLCGSAAVNTDLHIFVKAGRLRVLLQGDGGLLVGLGNRGRGGQRLDARQHRPGLGQVSGHAAALPFQRAAGVLKHREGGTG